MSFNDDGFVLQEIKPFTYEMIVRNYYKNSIIKSKGKFLCHSSVKIGIWCEYDNQGNLIKETDEDKKFEKLRLKPINILRWLEKEGYIDRKTGKGQEKFVKEGVSLIMTSTFGCRLVLKGQRLSLRGGLSILQNTECALPIVSMRKRVNT